MVADPSATDTLSTFDQDLQARLTAIDPAAPFPAAFSVIAKHSLREAVHLADRFLALPEICSAHELQQHPERIDRRLEAAKLLQDNAASLTAEELGRAIAHGRVGLDHSAIYRERYAKLLLDHPDLATPERKFACLVAATETAATHIGAATLVTWLGQRLVETPYLEGTARLAELHRAGKISADVVGATGDRALLEALAPESLACAFALDPSTAFDRFGDRLVDTKPWPQGLLQLLHVLAQDGFSTHGLAGRRSTRPRGWVRADPRWIAPLMKLRASDDPNLSIPAGNALGNCDLDKVLDLLPKPKKRIPGLAIDVLGTVTQARQSWLGGGRVIVADGSRALIAHALSPGLPVVARFELPEGVELQTSPTSSVDDPWETPGIHAVAVRADGGIAIGAQTASFAHVIALYDASGERVALRTLDEVEGRSPHALVFGAGGTGSLWAALVDEEGHRVSALSPTDLSPRGHVRIAKEYPSPAFFAAGTHTDDDVAIVDIACGQDGAWLPIVEAGPKLRKHKLTGKQATIAFACASGAKAAFASARTLTLRAWPTLDAPAKKRLDGTVVGAGLVDGAIGLALAEVSNEPSAIELRRLEDGERIGKARYPIGARFRALDAGVLVTEDDDGSITVHRIRPSK